MLTTILQIMGECRGIRLGSSSTNIIRNLQLNNTKRYRLFMVYLLSMYCYIYLYKLRDRYIDSIGHKPTFARTIRCKVGNIQLFSLLKVCVHIIIHFHIDTNIPILVYTFIFPNSIKIYLLRSLINCTSLAHLARVKRLYQNPVYIFIRITSRYCTLY